jgi:hypothetical protein
MVFFQSFGYVYQLSVMKKIINHQSGDSQVVIGIGDYHDKNHPANKDQRSYIEALIKKCKKGKLIVEDLSSVNNDGRGMCCSYIINARGGILGKLADVVRADSGDVDNVEYRYCRVAALGPLLNNVQAEPSRIASTSMISLTALTQEVSNEIERIKQYDDGGLLNALYKRTALEVTKALKQLRLDETKYKTVADYCGNVSKKNYSKELEKMCIFDSPIIDMKILHSIVSSPDKSVIVVAAGGSHIEKVNTLLAMLGYKNIVAPAGDFLKYHAVESALGSEVKKADSLATPPALDMHVLDQFIN